MVTTTTPKEINDTIRKFCRTIEPTQEAVRLQVQPEPGAKYDDCYQSVARKQNRDHGSLQYGWIIWEWENILLEAEFHAVWVHPEGDLLDVSPKADGEKEIIFLPDSKRVYQNKSVPSFRMALREDPILEAYIEAANEFDRLKEQYSNKSGIPEVPLYLAAPVQQRMHEGYIKLGGKASPSSITAMPNMRFKEREFSPREKAEERRRQRKKAKRKKK